MIKSFSLLARRPGMSHEEFVRHWHDVHVPMSKDVPGLRGYIVSTVVERQTRSDVPGFALAPFDGAECRLQQGRIGRCRLPLR